MISKHLLGTVLAGNLLMVLSGISVDWIEVNWDRIINIHYTLDYITIALFIGEILGSIIFSLLAEFIGRKYCLLAISIPFIAGFITSEFFYQRTIVLCIARTLSGLSVGGTFAVLPIYIVEISETKNRGKLISLTFTSFIAGVFVVAGILRFIIYGATFLSLGGILISLIFVIAFALVAPESPYYSLKKGDQDISRRTLDKLSGQRVDNEIELHDMQGKVEQEENDDATERVMACLNLPGWVKSVIMVLAITISEAVLLAGTLPTYGFLTRTDLSYKVVPIVVELSPLISTCVCAILVDVVGRKLLLIFLYGLCAVSITILLILTVIADNTTAPITPFAFALPALIYRIGVTGGLSGIRLIFIAELFSSNKKMIASGVLTALFFGIHLCMFYVYRYFIYISNFIFPVVCILFMAISISIVVKFFYIETKGKGLNQIQLILNKK